VDIGGKPAQILFRRAFEQNTIHALWIFFPPDIPPMDDS
jgi:hypothetical protein